MKKIITVLGARPQFIKAAVISRELTQLTNGIEEHILHTGQHFDGNMSDIFFDQMSIPRPRYHFDIHGLSHGAMTGRMLENIESVLLRERPQLVLVYGDTNSTLAGALAASKLHIPIAHVEAGLRSGNMKMPEEINRILSDRISNLLFCPTSQAMKNLDNEGFANLSATCIQSGDVMEDAALYYASQVDSKRQLSAESYVLATLHRQENTDDPEILSNWINALNLIHRSHKVIMPLHPRTRQKLEQAKLKVDFETLEPQGYLEMIQLTKNADLVVTDSGGLQKEAFFFSKFCLTMRNETEWTELIEHGYNFLCQNGEDLISRFHQMVNKAYPLKENLYGNGTAGKKIVQSIAGFLL